MFIPSVTRESAARTGIPLAHRSSDKFRELYDAEETLPDLPGFAIALEYHHPRFLKTNFPLAIRQYSVYNPLVCVLVVHQAGTGEDSTSTLTVCAWSGCLVAATATTVRALYAGTLATIWTTAPSLPQRPTIQLAAVCLLLATVTIAARCYAYSSATHPLVQFNTTPSSFSPIDNSNAQVPHSSNLVLSRLLKSPHQPVQSDTSVIVINSKKLLHNQNSNSVTRRKRSRTKREVVKTPSLYNRLHPHRTIISTSSGTSKLDLEERAGAVVEPGNSANSGVGASARVNSSNTVSPSEAHDQTANGNAPSARAEGTERPMPPVHDHGNTSSVSDWGILVLILSAIVLTVALGLITCVLSHYRPVAGDGAADGGTAADPHDAARTPTTAPMLSVVSAGAAAGVGGMDRLRGGRAARELAATRDRQVRLHAVHTDIAINLPPSIAMPDGEEHPYTNSRLHMRDPEQESEIHQKCIRPPPNRTVLESESPPPYRSSSAGLLGSSTSSCSTSSSGVGGDWSGGGGCGSAPQVVRCHSMSSTSSSSSSKRPEAGCSSSGQKTDFLQRTVKIFTGGKRGTGSGGAPPPVHQQTLPVVIVPTRPRRTSGDQQSAATPRSKPSV